MADETAIEHALRNSIENAVKYGAEGGNWIGISAALVEGAVEIRVTDRGPGIPPDEQERIFDPFFRGRRALRDHVYGTGLGLEIARKIIDAHGGTLRVHSEPGKPTEFVVRIPPRRRVRKPNSSRMAQHKGGTAHVLVCAVMVCCVSGFLIPTEGS